jgi:dolichyl-phosphate-mannose--protein O-mannosyl transferase
VFVEILLNAIGALTWDLEYWNTHFPVLIFLIGYLPFFAVGYWVHDMQSRRQQVVVVGTLALIVGSALLVFGVVLRWS